MKEFAAFVQLSKLNKVENETHYLFFCEQYDILRANWFSKINKPENFHMLDEESKLSIVLNQPENCKQSAQFIADAYGLRSKLINRKINTRATVV